MHVLCGCWKLNVYFLLSESDLMCTMYVLVSLVEDLMSHCVAMCSFSCCYGSEYVYYCYSDGIFVSH